MIENILKAKPILFKDYPFLIINNNSKKGNMNNNIYKNKNKISNHLVFIDVETKPSI